MISIFDIFKVGIGPSSSHTVGPMRAAARFSAELGERMAREEAFRPARLRVTLYGSLAWTAQGHGTDRAVALGLCGEAPETVPLPLVMSILDQLEHTGEIEIALPDTPGISKPSRVNAVAFQPSRDLVLDRDTLPPHHPNTLQFEALDSAGRVLLTERFCSVGGGFIVPENSLENAAYAQPDLPYPFRTGNELLELTRRTGLSIAALTRANEEAQMTGTAEERCAAVNKKLDHLIDVMMDCIEQGLSRPTSGPSNLLPGRLGAKRRAPAMYQRLLEREARAPAHTLPHARMDWVSLFAMAVNEENAGFGRVVTAPTNGAAGVVPAVLRYWREFCAPPLPSETEVPDRACETRTLMRDFLLTAGTLGALFKLNASISGAEVGCQGEVGVAASMAAGGLASVLGATPQQVENAAESAMEHHLGLTCDPVGGLVQIPCIERNAFGAIKAINAASLALCGDGSHRVSLDQVIHTMKETGRDMNARYKETSQGGLALNFPEC
ncbi:L-serine ammonia-lyase [Oecophyllibacter saccharovorans]|uniref:L-serine ammonia-lyase n=1 Tax=Oecophyllibacter saccharovorans TaxID=2558360 RepID=A0A506UKM6_9PROT|nr:L-serine ammonia-lyase [Oecophyllibacter saccharovorans]TPW33889.1 L-serine ammonia-lyase [Oecophyllibacter saccharovorans]